MIPNRYYTITIISIFFSLGLGILIGGTLGQQWIQSNEQKVISYFEDEANQYKKTNKEYQKKQKQLENQLIEEQKDSRELLGKSIVHMLNGKKILWIDANHTNTKGQSFLTLKEAIRVAGGVREQLTNNQMVFQSLSDSGISKQGTNSYDLIILTTMRGAVNRDVLLDPSIQTSETPIVVLSDTTRKIKELENRKNVLYHSKKIDSISAQYDFLYFLKNLIEEQKG
ncbi:copper transporter [Tepidibacillus marianensis]|uniref:copper transporter n=1 Tax=Tepidibacillus marianensis TaxID=3131995 RepID=UPI0030CDCBFA